MQVLLLSIGAVYIGYWLHFMFLLRAFDLVRENYASGEYSDLYVRHYRHTVARPSPLCTHACMRVHTRRPCRMHGGACRYNVGEAFQMTYTIAGVLGLGYFIKFFEYLGLEKRMRYATRLPPFPHSALARACVRTCVRACTHN
ncbi:hypothetical protein EON62_00590 [archaeon]|nr:MAG: hypothetical protein EON62_00590 [archaeon]